jgi:hypothetical protein
MGLPGSGNDWPIAEVDAAEAAIAIAAIQEFRDDFLIFYPLVVVIGETGHFIVLIDVYY